MPSSDRDRAKNPFRSELITERIEARRLPASV
jgi:hypothetical protein